MCWDHLIEAEDPRERMPNKSKPALPEPAFDRLLDDLLKTSPVQAQAPGS